MSDDLVLGIDVGTTSVKCVVMKVDKQFKVIFFKYMYLTLRQSS